jgi:hypothetical protein
MAGNKNNKKEKPVNYTTEEQKKKFANRDDVFHRKHVHGQSNSTTHIKYQKGNAYFN